MDFGKTSKYGRGTISRLCKNLISANVLGEDSVDADFTASESVF